jgi:hypothetical protein
MLSLSWVVIYPVHASAGLKNSTKASCALADSTSTCISTNLPVSTSDLIILHVTCYDVSTPFSKPTVADSLGNIFTQIQSSLTGTANQDVVWYSFSGSAGNDIVTVTANSCNEVTHSGWSPYDLSFSFETFTGITGIGQVANNGSPSQLTNCSTSCSDNVNITTNPTSIVYETFFVNTFANQNICPTNIQSGSSATILQNDCSTASPTTGDGFATFYKQISVGGLQTLSVSWTTTTQFSLGYQMAIELLTQSTTQSFITQCYGECGSPAITIQNPNATHTINFNQSLTLFYEFQSTLSGLLLNETVNVAKSYSNGQQIGLGVYTASCAIGQTPFTTQCAGTLQPGSGVSPFVVSKGQFSISLNLNVVPQEWVGIAVSGYFSGLDLNETNGTCGDGTSGICVNGMQYTSGFLPQIISTSQACATSSSTPCDVSNLSKTGMWAWIQGNIIKGASPPPPSAGCINSDLSCFLIASACGLTPSNCFIGGGVFLFIYFVIFVAGITICISYINKQYDTQVHFPPALFFLFFLVELFMFAAIGLIPTYVVIVIFIFTGLGVAGYFGSGFAGRGKSE